MKTVLYLFLALILLPGIAFAESAYAIDFRPLVSEFVVPVQAGLLGILATWITTRLAGWLKLKQDDELRKVIETGMQKGLAFALSKLDDATKGVPLTFEVKNKIIADASNYAIGAAPDALKKLGVDKDTIEKAVAARLEVIVNPALPTPAI